MANNGYFILTDISGYTEYLTESELEEAHETLQNLFDVQLGGRTRPESKFHCAHSSGDFFNKVVDWKTFEYYPVYQNVAGLEYHRTIKLKYDGMKTKFMVLVRKPEQEAPEGFREFLEMPARQGYERIPAALQSQLEDEKITFLPDETATSRGVGRGSDSARDN